MIRNVLHALSAAGILWLAPAQARAEDAYPSHNITMVVSYTPGGITDTLARIAAEAIQNGLKQTVIVENRAGAGGLIGNSYVARSAPDGYTLLTAPTAFGIQPFTYKKLPYDTLNDFAPVSLIGQSATVMVVSPKLGVNTLQEFIDLAKKPGSHLSYASNGMGTPSQLSVEYFCNLVGIKLQHVPYPGSAPASLAVMSGDVAMTLLDMAPAIELIKSGKLKALAVTAPKRHYNMPDTPTIGETVPGFAALSWTGVLARGGTPKPIINKINAALTSYLKSDAGVKRLRSIGVDASPTSPDEMTAWIKSQLALWKPVVKAAGIVPQ
jgi:tripartite-type tricarboxylate transporter receptor subunit TctC